MAKMIMLTNIMLSSMYLNGMTFIMSATAPEVNRFANTRAIRLVEVKLIALWYLSKNAPSDTSSIYSINHIVKIVIKPRNIVARCSTTLT